MLARALARAARSRAVCALGTISFVHLCVRFQCARTLRPSRDSVGMTSISLLHESDRDGEDCVRTPSSACSIGETPFQLRVHGDRVVGGGRINTPLVHERSLVNSLDVGGGVGTRGVASWRPHAACWSSASSFPYGMLPAPWLDQRRAICCPNGPRRSGCAPSSLSQHHVYVPRQCGCDVSCQLTMVVLPIARFGVGKEGSWWQRIARVGLRNGVEDIGGIHSGTSSRAMLGAVPAMLDAGGLRAGIPVLVLDDGVRDGVPQ